LLVEGVDVRLHGVEVRLRACGFAGLAREPLSPASPYIAIEGIA
jgi:hypothetical protein